MVIRFDFDHTWSIIFEIDPITWINTSAYKMKDPITWINTSAYKLKWERIYIGKSDYAIPK